MSTFPRQGIDTLDLSDLRYAAELGYTVKLLAVARLVNGKLEMHVQPTLVRHHTPVPTQIVSSDEYLPLPQTAQQREVEVRLIDMSERLAERQGMSRRRFLVVNAVGSLLWVACFALIGYLPAVKLRNTIGATNIDKYILPVVALIVIVSLMPVLLEIIRVRRATQQAATTSEQDRSGAAR